MSRPTGNKGRAGHRWRRLRASILHASDICWLCGQPGADTVDHVIPLALGGAPEDPANLRPAHRSCNSRRGTRPATPPRTSRRW